MAKLSPLLCPRAQDFTDSAYTSNARRQNIVRHCDHSRSELARLLACLDSAAQPDVELEDAARDGRWQQKQSRERFALFVRNWCNMWVAS